MERYNLSKRLIISDLYIHLFLEFDQLNLTRFDEYYCVIGRFLVLLTVVTVL